MIPTYEYRVLNKGLIDYLEADMNRLGKNGFRLVGLDDKIIIMELETLDFDEHQEEIENRLQKILDRQGQKG